MTTPLPIRHCIGCDESIRAVHTHEFLKIEQHLDFAHLPYVCFKLTVEISVYSVLQKSS